MKSRIFIFLALIFALSGHAAELPLNRLKLPPGFSISLYAYPVPGARSMALGNNNIVFVGTLREGKVYAIVPDAETKKTKIYVIASGLFMPNGIAFHDNNLYVAEVNRILRFNNIEKHLENPPQPSVITSNLPDKTEHGWRYLRIGPDNKLYFGIGMPCNVCLNDDNRFGTIMRMNLDGTQQEIYAKGIRNTVGFDWNPADNTLWFTDNGRDRLGNDIPPDELNHASNSNLNFGFPHCHGKNILDPEFGKGYSCSQFVAPVLELPAHVAALGMHFYKGKMFPSEYHGQIFIAEHGSWNRDNKVGYQVISVKLTSDNKIKQAQFFVTGWLDKENNWGRPVDLLEMADGSLLISDDDAGAIYRVTYK